MDTYWTVETLHRGTWTRQAGPFTESKAAERARPRVMGDQRRKPIPDRPSHVRVRKHENGKVTTVGREQYIGSI